MKLKKLSKTPKNPRHFIAMLFSLSKRDSSVRENNHYLVIKKEFMDRALVECAYGYFYVSKDKKVLSKDFF